MTDRAVIVKITPDLLGELLQLPEGAYIDHVAIEDRVGVLALRVRGMGPEVKPGDLLTEIRGTLTLTHVIERKITWPAPLSQGQEVGS